MIEMWGERLRGESVFDASVLQGRIQRESYWLLGPVMSAAISALDTALWDAKARALGVPLYVLLGGKARSEERRVGKECSVRVDLGGRLIIKKKKNHKKRKE